MDVPNVAMSKSSMTANSWCQQVGKWVYIYMRLKTRCGTSIPVSAEVWWEYIAVKLS